MPKTKKQYRQKLPSSFLSDGEVGLSKFKGWATDSVKLDKVLYYKKIVQNIENQVKRDENVLNGIKSLIKMFVRTTEDIGIMAIANYIPSFTEDLVLGGTFISEFSYDSDDESNINIAISTDDDETSSGGNSDEKQQDKEMCPITTDNDKKLHLRPVVALSALNNLNLHKDRGADTRNEGINSVLQDTETNIIKNCFILVSDCQKNLESTKSLDKLHMGADDNFAHDHEESEMEDYNMEDHNNSEVECISTDIPKIMHNRPTIKLKNLNTLDKLHKGNKGADDNFALDCEESEMEDYNMEDHNNSDVECISTDIKKSMHNTPIIKFKKQNSHLAFRNNYKICSTKVKGRKQLKEKRIYSISTPNSKNQIITIVPKRNTGTKENTTEDFKHLKTVDKFLNTVSQVTSTSQILNLMKKNFACKYCNNKFIRRAYLVKHMRVCKKQGDKLNKRTKIIHNEGSYTCKLCGTWLKHKRGLTRHNEQMHSLVKTFKCVICRWGFYNERMLQHHVMSRHGLSLTKHMKCPYCEHAFRRREDLNFHCKNKHKRDCFLCYLCFKTFDDETEWKAHEESHGYMCDVCDFSSENEDEVATHKLIHLKIVRYKCELCSNIYKAKRYLTRHMKNKHNKQQT